MDNIIELLKQADETSLNMSDTLAAEGATPAITTIFMGLLTVIQTAKETLLALQNPIQAKPQAEAAVADPRELERGRSLVLIGLPESQAKLPSEQVAADHATVTRVLDQLGVETARLLPTGVADHNPSAHRSTSHQSHSSFQIFSAFVPGPMETTPTKTSCRTGLGQLADPTITFAGPTEGRPRST